MCLILPTDWSLFLRLNAKPRLHVFVVPFIQVRRWLRAGLLLRLKRVRQLVRDSRTMCPSNLLSERYPRKSSSGRGQKIRRQDGQREAEDETIDDVLQDTEASTTAPVRAGEGGIDTSMGKRASERGIDLGDMRAESSGMGLGEATQCLRFTLSDEVFSACVMCMVFAGMWIPGQGKEWFDAFV